MEFIEFAYSIGIQIATGDCMDIIKILKFSSLTTSSDALEIEIYAF